MSIEDLTEFESRLIRWISSSDFVEIPWSTRRASEAFKVEEEEVYCRQLLKELRLEEGVDRWLR